MVRKLVLALLVLFINLFIAINASTAIDFGDNNLFVPTVNINMQREEVQDIINKTQQLESKVESERNTLKTSVDEKKADYLATKKRFNDADKQLRAVRSVTRKLQKSF